MRATIDRNRNGQVEPDEAETATTDSERAYRLEVGINTGVINWTPADHNVTLVDVLSSADEAKRLVGSTADSLVQPITYGVTPAGAQQLFPTGGKQPVPLASGDTVQIVLSGTSVRMASCSWPERPDKRTLVATQE